MGCTFIRRSSRFPTSLGPPKKFVTVLLATIMVVIGLPVFALSAQASGRLSGAEYVALGDSYASGEGLGDYEAGTDESKGAKKNTCHRSDHAFSTLSTGLVLPDVQDRSFWACSGATSQQMMNTPPQSGKAEQYAQPKQVSTAGVDTKWISVVAGGDDLKFGDIGKACAQVVVNHSSTVRYPGSMTCTKQLALSRSLISSMKSNLTRMYTQLLIGSPKAAIVVVGYPRIFPAKYDGVPVLNGSPFCVFDHYPVALFQTLDAGMPVEDAKDLDLFVGQLNKAVEDAVVEVQKSRPLDAYRVRYVDTYESSTPRNCRGTTSDASVSGIQLSARRPLQAFLSTATFHPTTAGQKMLASRVQSAFESFAPVIRSSVPGATVGLEYSQQLLATDNRPGVWAMVSGNLPPGLNLAGDRIVGTPKQTGTFSVTLSFTDSRGSIATSLLSLAVANDGLPPVSDPSPGAPSNFVVTPDLPNCWDTQCGLQVSALENSDEARPVAYGVVNWPSGQWEFAFSQVCCEHVELGSQLSGWIIADNPAKTSADVAATYCIALFAQLRTGQLVGPSNTQCVQMQFSSDINVMATAKVVPPSDIDWASVVAAHPSSGP